MPVLIIAKKWSQCFCKDHYRTIMVVHTSNTHLTKSLIELIERVV